MLDEMQLRESIAIERIGSPEVVILLELTCPIAATLHRLKQHQVPCDVFMDQIKRQQRVPQMIENAHEDHEIKGLVQRCHVVNRHVSEFDVKVVYFGGEPRLREIFVAAVQPEHPVGAAALHLLGIEPALQPMSSTVFPFRLAGTTSAKRRHFTCG